jgi:uncharacterized pyridoxal phosphate-containing UPF0001 family protein
LPICRWRKKLAWHAIDVTVYYQTIYNLSDGRARGGACRVFEFPSAQQIIWQVVGKFQKKSLRHTTYRVSCLKSVRGITTNSVMRQRLISP